MKNILSFREIPDKAWGYKHPDFDEADKMLNWFREPSQEKMEVPPCSDGACWYTMNNKLKPEFQGCHSRLVGSVNANPFLFNGVLKLESNKQYQTEMDIYSKWMSSDENPAWKESLDKAYICRQSATDDRIIGWVWPNLKTTPAYQTTHFCIATRDLSEHSFIFLNFMKYYDNKNYANGDARLAWMLCQYFTTGEENKLRPNVRGHNSFSPNWDGNIPLAYIYGPGSDTKKARDSWSLYVNKYYQIFDSKGNMSINEFVNRYKVLVEKGE